MSLPCFKMCHVPFACDINGCICMFCMNLDTLIPTKFSAYQYIIRHLYMYKNKLHIIQQDQHSELCNNDIPLILDCNRKSSKPG
jgi:hypothetical protein